MRRAFTRAVSPRLAQCELTHLERVPIDGAGAAEQHACYEDLLRGAGFDVIRLPDLPQSPDGVFVEDTALLLGSNAIILRPGALSRSVETDSTARGLEPFFTLHRIDAGHVDGGDILRIGSRLYVGLSTRTDAEGIEALAQVVEPMGFEVVRTELRDCLHLKTGATFVGEDQSGTPVVVLDELSVDASQFSDVDCVAVAPGERPAANCVRANDRLILAAGNPRTAAALRERGFLVMEVDVSELQKAEAGVTCMSLVDDRG